MKKVILITLVVLFGLISTQTFGQKKENNTVCFKSNMHCESCQATLTDHLRFEKGVKNLKIDWVTNTILIEYKSDKNNDDNLAKAIEKKGYQAIKIPMGEYKEMKDEADSDKKSETQKEHK